MGIAGLLPLLKGGGCTEKCHIKRYKGKRVGIDASTWLHRGAYGCATALALERPCDSYVRYFLRLIDMLRHHDVEPFVVFDGSALPSKALTTNRRREQRQGDRAKGLAAHKAGDAELANSHFQKCISVTHGMVKAVIEELRRAKVEFIVAPYEADAQLAFLARTDQVAAVITEDSDLALYDCKHVFTKMDTYGEGVDVDLTKLTTLAGFRTFKDDMFLDMCILSGCDYVDSVHGVGLKTAQKLITKWRTLERVAKQLKFEKKCEASYLDDVLRAKATFQHHWVYENRQLFGRKMVALSGRDASAVTEEECEFLGGYMERRVVQRVAHGELNPKRYRQELQQEQEKKEAEAQRKRCAATS